MDALNEGWKVGIFACFSPEDCGECLIGFFLPCYNYAKIVEGLGEVQCCFEDPNDFVLQFITFMIPFNQLLGSYWARQRCRAKYGIQGSTVSDCCAVLLCSYGCNFYQIRAQLKG